MTLKVNPTTQLLVLHKVRAFCEYNSLEIHYDGHPSDGAPSISFDDERGRRWQVFCPWEEDAKCAIYRTHMEGSPLIAGPVHLASIHPRSLNNYLYKIVE